MRKKPLIWPQSLVDAEWEAFTLIAARLVELGLKPGFTAIGYGEPAARQAKQCLALLPDASALYLIGLKPHQAVALVGKVRDAIPDLVVEGAAPPTDRNGQRVVFAPGFATAKVANRSLERQVSMMVESASTHGWLALTLPRTRDTALIEAQWRGANRPATCFFKPRAQRLIDGSRAIQYADTARLETALAAANAVLIDTVTVAGVIGAIGRVPG